MFINVKYIDKPEIKKLFINKSQSEVTCPLSTFVLTGFFKRYGFS